MFLPVILKGMLFNGVGQSMLARFSRWGENRGFPFIHSIQTPSRQVVARLFELSE